MNPEPKKPPFNAKVIAEVLDYLEALADWDDGKPSNVEFRLVTAHLGNYGLDSAQRHYHVNAPPPMSVQKANRETIDTCIDRDRLVKSMLMALLGEYDCKCREGTDDQMTVIRDRVSRIRFKLESFT